MYKVEIVFVEHCATKIWAVMWSDEDSDQLVQTLFKLRDATWGSASSLTIIAYSSDKQRLWSVCAYAQAGQSFC